MSTATKDQHIHSPILLMEHMWKLSIAYPRINPTSDRIKTFDPNFISVLDEGNLKCDYYTWSIVPNRKQQMEFRRYESKSQIVHGRPKG